MSTHSLRKAGARAGGLVATLAVAGTMSIAGASAASAYGSCNIPNPHPKCHEEVPEEDKQTEIDLYTKCIPAAGIGFFTGGPKAAAGAGGTCTWMQIVE